MVIIVELKSEKPIPEETFTLVRNNFTIITGDSEEVDVMDFTEESTVPTKNVYLTDKSDDVDVCTRGLAISAAIRRLMARPANIDILITANKYPKRSAVLATSGAFVLNVDDSDTLHTQLAMLRTFVGTYRDAARYRALKHLGCTRHIGSAGFNGRDLIKNDHYYHFSIDFWSTGYEGAYVDQREANAEMFDTYTDVLIANAKNGMTGR